MKVQRWFFGFELYTWPKPSLSRLLTCGAWTLPVAVSGGTAPAHWCWTHCCLYTCQVTHAYCRSFTVNIQKNRMIQPGQAQVWMDGNKAIRWDWLQKQVDQKSISRDTNYMQSHAPLKPWTVLKFIIYLQPHGLSPIGPAPSLNSTDTNCTYRCQPHPACASAWV
jgi:hypothetical protein